MTQKEKLPSHVFLLYSNRKVYWPAERRYTTFHEIFKILLETGHVEIRRKIDGEVVTEEILGKNIGHFLRQEFNLAPSLESILRFICDRQGYVKIKPKPICIKENNDNKTETKKPREYGGLPFGENNSLPNSN